jgi:hypothetical protein
MQRHIQGAVARGSAGRISRQRLAAAPRRTGRGRHPVAVAEALWQAGLKLTHLDSHHHVHWMPELFAVFSQ